MDGHDPRGQLGGLRPTAGRHFISDAILASVIAVLLVATLACAVALAPPIWAAVSKGFATANNNNPRVCAAIENAKDRLACFDKYAEGLMTPSGQRCVRSCPGVRSQEASARSAIVQGEVGPNYNASPQFGQFR
jgi:hypothetical protein